MRPGLDKLFYNKIRLFFPLMTPRQYAKFHLSFFYFIFFTIINHSSFFLEVLRKSGPQGFTHAENYSWFAFLPIGNGNSRDLNDSPLAR